MTGTLGLFSLADLFQLLASSARSGRLTVDHPEGIARIFFEEGRAVHAEFGALSGEEAVYALFANEQGSFEFMLGVPAPRQSVRTRTENLVLEASRRVDEAVRDVGRSVDAEAILAFNEDASAQGDLKLDQTEVALLREVDGKRSVGEIVRATGIELGAAQANLQELLRKGVLRVVGRRPRTARLVARLASNHIPHGSAGMDPHILNSWSEALGYPVENVACRRPDGSVCTLRAVSVPEAGPFLVASRDTLIFANLHVDQPLLVRPLHIEAPTA